MGMLITPIYAPFYIRSPKGSFPFLREEDFSGFSPEPFLRVITADVIIITATIITTTIIIITLIIITITTTVIGSTPIRVKVFPFKDIFKSSVQVLLYNAIFFTVILIFFNKGIGLFV